MDYIEGLSPAIAINQKAASATPALQWGQLLRFTIICESCLLAAGRLLSGVWKSHAGRQIVTQITDELVSAIWHAGDDFSTFSAGKKRGISQALGDMLKKWFCSGDCKRENDRAGRLENVELDRNKNMKLI